jgi:hypothetical protein
MNRCRDISFSPHSLPKTESVANTLSSVAPASEAKQRRTALFPGIDLLIEGRVDYHPSIKFKCRYLQFD